MDLACRGALDMGRLRMLVVDEADLMLEQGFKEQLQEIFGSGVPGDAQVMLFSATMPPEALEMAGKLLRDPLRILVPAEELSVEGIAQYKVEVKDELEKTEVMVELYSALSVEPSLVFCNTRARVEQLAAFMREQRFTVDVIHAELRPAERAEALAKFRSGATRVLIASGVLSRGVDVQSLSLVVNFDLPRGERGVEEYLHRVGRVGRYGRKGVAVNLVAARAAFDMRGIEEHYGIRLGPPPEFASLAPAWTANPSIIAIPRESTTST
jgi:translation initiation factor 4A